MATLYIFAIGGSGARVIRSLTMLFAAGLKPGNFDEVVPILIDPDTKNGSLRTTSELLNKYQELRGESGYADFFKTKLRPIDKGNFCFEVPAIKNANDNKIAPEDQFEDYIGFKSLKDDAVNLVKLLFSGKVSDEYSPDLLKLKMDKGFVGNPNIGSVVMSNFVNSQAFDKFVSNIKGDDRVLFITSIFGGTGAAGFPAILNKIRNHKKTDGTLNTDVSDAIVGSITMLPYYKVKDKDGGVKNSAFIPKTKSALFYYMNSVYFKVESFYYVGMDEPETIFENKTGGEEQKNRALFAEFVAALAVFDFAEDNFAEDNIERNKERGKKFKQFFDLSKELELKLSDIPIDEKDKLGKRKKLELPLEKLFLLKTYIETKLKSNIDAKREWTGLRINKEDGVKERDINVLETFIKNDLNSWLEELSKEDSDVNPKPKFTPFGGFSFEHFTDMSIDDFSVLLDSRAEKFTNPKFDIKYVLDLMNSAINDGQLKMNKAAIGG